MREALLAAALLLALPAHGADGEAAALGEKFCTLRMAGDEDGLRGLLTTGLLGIIAEAEARNAVIAADAPGDKPPLGDGLPWAAFPDLAEDCLPGEVARSDNLVLVGIGYALEPGGRPQWTDRLVLRREGEELRIDDILFHAFPNDSYRPGMRRLLADMFDQ